MDSGFRNLRVISAFLAELVQNSCHDARVALSKTKSIAQFLRVMELLKKF